MKIKRIKNFKPIWVTLLYFILFFIPLFVVEISLIMLIEFDIAEAINRTLNFFFGIESPFQITVGVENQFLCILIIIFGYLLVITSWLGGPILIVQYLFNKKRKEIEIKQKLEDIMIHAEIERKGGYGKLTKEELLQVLENGKKNANVVYDKIKKDREMQGRILYD